MQKEASDILRYHALWGGEKKCKMRTPHAQLRCMQADWLTAWKPFLSTPPYVRNGPARKNFQSSLVVHVCSSTKSRDVLQAPTDSGDMHSHILYASIDAVRHSHIFMTLSRCCLGRKRFSPMHEPYVTKRSSFSARSRQCSLNRLRAVSSPKTSIVGFRVFFVPMDGTAAELAARSRTSCTQAAHMPNAS